jgi:hypothetical protein
LTFGEKRSEWKIATGFNNYLPSLRSRDQLRKLYMNSVWISKDNRNVETSLFPYI